MTSATAPARTRALTAPCGCRFSGRYRYSGACTEAGADYRNNEITGRQLTRHMTAALKRLQAAKNESE